jgi:ubiquinone/menaquinone biosynthesis C-methylase UbiE
MNHEANGSHTPAETGSVDSLPNLAAGVPANQGQLILTRRLRLLQGFLPWPRQHLVDVGCGNGAQTLLFLDRFDRLTGVELNPEFLALFQAEADRMGVAERVAGVLSAGEDIPLPDESADCVTCFTVLEHVNDELATLREMKRVLRPGGRLLLTVPNRWWIFETHGADLPVLPWNRVPFVSWWPTKLHDRYARARIYRKRDVRELLRQAGFQVETAFNMTAPMDMVKWVPLRSFLRGTLFRRDRTSFPILSTEIVVVATR